LVCARSASAGVDIDAFPQRNWQNKSEIADLRQEVYLRVFEGAKAGLPEYTKRFLLIDQKKQVAPIYLILLVYLFE